MSHGLLATLAVAVLLGYAAPAAGHSRLGEYQDMASADREWETPYPLVRGLPMVTYASGPERNPVTIAQYGLANWSLGLRYRERGRMRTARRAARWLVRHQTRAGTWTYRFDYRVPGSTMMLDAGWASALAQGQAISLLRRVHHATGRRRYLRAARRALAALRTPVREGGLARWHNGGIWFEEYPSRLPSLVLNGMLQTLIGLYDLADVSPTARRLLRRGLRTVVRTLQEFAHGAHWSLYSLVDQVGFGPFPATPDYHSHHVKELRLLDELRPRRAFRRWARRWAAAGQPARQTTLWTNASTFAGTGLGPQNQR